MANELTLPKMHYPFMTIQTSPQGMIINIVRSQFDVQQILVATENAIQFCADFIPTLPYGVQQDLIARIHKTNKVNQDITRTIKAVK